MVERLLGLDSSDFVEQRMFHASDENDEKMNEDDCLGEYDVWDTESSIQRNHEMNELQVLYNAVLILKQKVGEILKLDLPWPPVASALTMNNIKKVVPHELFNTLAWICGLSSEPVLNDYVNIKDKENKKMPNCCQ